MALLRQIRSPFAGGKPEGQGAPAFETRSVGELLRKQRIALDIAIDEAAAALRIKSAYLLAIEEGHPLQLPGATYAVGFVRSYSEFLGLDSAELVRQFKLESVGINAKPDLTFPMPLAEGSLPAGRVLVLAAILTACAYGVWYHLNASEQRLPERVTEVPAGLLPSELGPAGPSKPTTAMTADGLASVRGPNSAFGSGSDKTEPEGSAALATRQSGFDRGQNPVGSGPPLPETASFPAETSSAKPIADSPPAVHGTAGTAFFRLPGPAAAVPQASPAALARTGPLPSAPAALSRPPDAPMTETSAAVLAEGEPHTAGGPSAVRSQSNDGAGAHGTPERQSRITLRANAGTWIQIRAANHSILFAGLLKPGDTYLVPDLPGLTMRTGNAGGLDVIIDGKPVSSTGPVGAVRNVSLSPQSLIEQSAAPR